MSKKSLYSLILIASLLGLVSLSAKIQDVRAPYLIITIEADGSISPSSANITTSDNVTYTFTADFNASIVIQRSNIVIDGNGRTLDGLDFTIWEGFNLTDVSNVTIINVNIEDFASYSIYLESASQCVVSDNTVTGSEGGIGLFSSAGNTISNNMISGCSEAVELVFSTGNNISLNNMSDSSTGVLSFNSTNNVISENNMIANSQGIYLNHLSNSNTITRNNITEYMYGVWFQNSSGNTVSRNNITGLSTGGGTGVYVSYSGYNIVSENYMKNHWSGVSMDYSFNNSITGNTMPHNYYGVHMQFSSPSNTISNNNITETHNIWHDGSGVYLVSSSNNTIDGNNLANNDCGIYVTTSSNNLIFENNVTGNWYSGFLMHNSNFNTIYRNEIANNSISVQGGSGISLDLSSNNTIFENNIVANHWWGINPASSGNNTILGNNVINNNVGINFDSSDFNVISANNIKDSVFSGIYLESSANNIFHHNNLINNSNQAVVELGYMNSWDDGVEGNYWSNYTGADLNHNGIGDTLHVIDVNNKDYYPLMGPLSSYTTSVGKNVAIISNSTVDSFQYESPDTIRFHISNKTANQTHGFCRVSIPYEVMSEPFTVTIDGVNPTYWNYTLYDNGTHRWIYFEYEHSTKEVVIIPEFPSFLILPLFMIATLSAALAYRRKQIQTP